MMYRVPALGRKWTMVIASGLMGASIFLLSVVDTVAKNEGLFTMEYFFQSMFNAVLYGWTPEAFPAASRSRRWEGPCGGWEYGRRALRPLPSSTRAFPPA